MKFPQIVVSTMSKNIRKIHRKNSYLSLNVTRQFPPKFQKFHRDPKILLRNIHAQDRSCGKTGLSIAINSWMIHVDVIEILYRLKQSVQIPSISAPTKNSNATIAALSFVAGNTESSQLFSGLRKI